MDSTKRIKTILIVIIALLLGFSLYLIISLLINSTRIDRDYDSDTVDSAYENAIKQLNEGKMEVSVSLSSETAVRQVVEAVYDLPEFFWLDRRYSISRVGSMYYIQFSEYYINHDEMLNEVDRIVDEIIADIPDSADAYQIVKYVHDELCNRISYVDTGDESEHNVYGALVLGKCVCEGYAKAFMYILNKVGIDTYYFAGTSMYEGAVVNHAWNGAYLDGDFYYFDVTWDDIESEYISYSEFALSSNDILRNHTFDEYHHMIDSTAIKYNYYYYNGYILSEYSKENVADLVKIQGNVIDIKCSSIVAYNKLVLAITNPYQLNEILTIAESDNVGFMSYSYLTDDSTYCVRLCFN